MRKILKLLAVVMAVAVVVAVVRSLITRRRSPSSSSSAPQPPRRLVTATGKDGHGAVTTLHGDWGSVDKAEAIADIEAGRLRYAVADGQELSVVEGGSGKYLRSEADGKSTDNLDELPDPSDT